MCRLLLAQGLLNLPNTASAGSLPSSWAAPTAFQNLQVLTLISTQITGMLPGRLDYTIFACVLSWRLASASVCVAASQLHSPDRHMSSDVARGQLQNATHLYNI